MTSGLRSASELSLVYAAAPGQSGSALRSGTMEGSADYFVFNFPGEKGFAIVVGDDRVRPVLGYSDKGSFDPDKLPENLRGMLAYYQDQITWANDKGIEATPDIAAEWSRYTSGTALRAAGEPVLLNTARWNQQEPYNQDVYKRQGYIYSVNILSAIFSFRYIFKYTHSLPNINILLFI